MPSYVALTLSILLFVLGSASAQTCSLGNGTISGQNINGVTCSCYSGFYSSAPNYADCLGVASDTCPFNAAATDLQTNYIPTIDIADSFVLGDTLTLVIESPLVSNRLYSTISIETGDATCSYPGGLWTKGVSTSDCQDTFTLVMPLSSAATCGFTHGDNSTYYNMNAILQVSHYDQIGTLRGTPITRETQSILRLQIRFPSTITLTSTVKIYSAINLLAAITVQSYSVTNAQATLQFTTSLQYPFQINAVNSMTLPSPLTATSVIDSSACLDTAGSVCTQTITLTVTPNAACTLTGAYSMIVGLSCRGSANCPIDSNTDTATVSANVVSENICAVVGYDIGLAGELAIFSDASHNNPKTAFLPGQTAYFLATVSSSQATITSSVLHDITYTYNGGNSQSLVTATTATALATANTFAIQNVGATSQGFSLVVSVGSDANSLFPVSVDANVDFIFTAVVDVTWVGTGGAPTSKRFSFSGSSTTLTGTQDTKVQTNMAVTNNNTQATPQASPISGVYASSSSIVASSGVVAAAMIVLNFL